jgi:hypothetical protein
MHWLLAWTQGRAAAPQPAAAQPVPLDSIRCQMVRALRGCTEPHRARGTDKVMAAACVTELWLLRCDLFQFLAHDLGESEAQRRMAGLHALFEGHVRLPPSPRLH